jgi:hypothetical protein
MFIIRKNVLYMQPYMLDFHGFVQAFKLVGVCTLYSHKKTACINAWKIYHTRLHVQYSLPDGEHKMFEICRRQEELN